MFGRFSKFDAKKVYEEAKRKQDVKQLIRVLEHDTAEPYLKSQAARALGDTADARAVDPLIRALASENKWIREEAAAALGKLKAVRATEALLAVLNDSEWGVRRSAATALGKIGDPRAVEPLIAALQNDSWVTKEAAAALGAIGDKRAIEPLVQVYNSWQSKEVAPALEKLGWKPEGDQGKWALARQDWAELAKIGPEVAKPLVAIITNEHNSEYARNKALETLSQIVRDNHEQIGLLLELAGTETSGISKTSVIKETLNSIGRPALPLLLEALESDNWRIRSVAAEVLHAQSWQEITTKHRALILMAKKEWDKIPALGNDAVPVLLSFIEDQYARETLITCGAAAVPYLVAALDENDVPSIGKIVQVLDALGWLPERPDHKALFAIALYRYDDIPDTGTGGVAPLLSVLIRHTKIILDTAPWALEQVMHDNLADIPEGILRRAARLLDKTHFVTIPVLDDMYPAESTEVTDYDCSTIRMLAMQELQRRGLEV
ncbi:MAG: HEAT repeat domain-containing protein [Anaerolineae bacterium]|nr:HEAT repeat domain-containing protein [Anaerolineae bacterium]